MSSLYGCQKAISTTCGTYHSLASGQGISIMEICAPTLGTHLLMKALSVQITSLVIAAKSLKDFISCVYTNTSSIQIHTLPVSLLSTRKHKTGRNLKSPGKLLYSISTVNRFLAAELTGDPQLSYWWDELLSWQWIIPYAAMSIHLSTVRKVKSIPWNQALEVVEMWVSRNH